MTYEVTEVRIAGGRVVREFRACLHDEHVIPVESVIDGTVVVVAYLCLDCDAQLPSEWADPAINTCA